MKRIFFLLIILSAVLLQLVVGCANKHEYDMRLAAADSVMGKAPNDALELLAAIKPNQLRRDCDLAYYALLMTQARYRCYIRATSDSLINVALDYYERHNEEVEKLTRTYIYKGAVMEELGEPEQAIVYYKRAAAVVAPKDYFNLGYINLRLGNINRDHIVADSSDIRLLKQSLYYFKQLPDSFYIMSCESAIGSSYIRYDKDSALRYLEQSNHLARQLHEHDIEQMNLRYIADLKLFNKNDDDIEYVKNIALSQLNNRTSAEFNHFLMIAAFTLAKQNKPDSATYYLNQLNEKPLSDGLRVLYDRCQAEIARSRGDISAYQFYYEQSDMLADSLSTNDMQRQLRDAEAKYDNETLKNDVLRYKTKWQISLLSTALALCLLAIAVMIASRKLAQRRSQLKASEDIIVRLQDDRAHLMTQLAHNEAMSEDLKATIHHQIDTFTQLVEMHWKQFTQHPKKFGELFKKAYSMKHPDKSFWAGLNAYADSTCSGIISKTMEAHDTLAEDDVRFLALCCCDLPTTVVMACMGYNDVHSVYNKKRRVAQELGLTCKLEDYIAQFR